MIILAVTLTSLLVLFLLPYMWEVGKILADMFKVMYWAHTELVQEMIHDIRQVFRQRTSK